MKRLLAALLLLSPMVTAARDITPSGNLVGHLTLDPQLNTLSGALNGSAVNGMQVVGQGTNTSIHAAIAALGPNGGTVLIPCGTYYENLTISVSNVILQGGGVNCTFLEPASNATMITIAASNSIPVQYVQLRDLTMQNVSGYNTADGIDITGPGNQINDWHHFQNLNIEGFEYGVNLIGRTIWTTFENVHIGGSLNDGVYANTASVINHVVFRDGQVNNSQNYGIYWNNSNANASQTIVLDHLNVEDNGLSGTLSNCAGLYLSGVGSALITGNYFEANCVKNPDSKGADIRISGTYAQSVDIRSSLIWSTTNYSIYNDAVQTTGTYEGNRFGGLTGDIKIATSHALSKIVVGANLFSNSNVYVPDGNNADHVIDLNASKQAPYSVNSITGNTMSVTNESYFEFIGGTFSLSTMTGGYTGQIVRIAARTATSITLANSSAANGFMLPNGNNVVIPSGGAATMILGGDGFWRILGPVSSLNLSDSSSIVHTQTPTAGQAACIKSAGPPVVIGYCSTVVGAGGACACN